MKMRLIFRSGAQVDVDVIEFTVKRYRVEGGLAGLDWTTPVGYAAKLSFVRLEEVAAIVNITEPGDDEDAPSGPLSGSQSAEQPAGVGQPTPEAPEGSQDGTAGGAA